MINSDSNSKIYNYDVILFKYLVFIKRYGAVCVYFFFKKHSSFLIISHICMKVGIVMGMPYH